MRYPFTTNPSSTIYGLTFFEAANGWYNYADYNPFRLRRSVGVGMRFFLLTCGTADQDRSTLTPGRGAGTRVRVPIPAYLLGNIWAQEWENIYPLVQPANADPGYDVTALLKKKDTDWKHMVKYGEGFFTSLGCMKPFGPRGSPACT